MVDEIEMIFRARVPPACGVLHRTGANRSSAGFGTVWVRRNNYVGASAVDVAWVVRRLKLRPDYWNRGMADVRNQVGARQDKGEGRMAPKCARPLRGARPSASADAIGHLGARAA